MRVSLHVVERLVQRQAGQVDQPEVRLICSALSAWIHQEIEDAVGQLAKGCARPGLAPFASPWWSEGFRIYCNAVGINPDALIQTCRELLFVAVDGRIEVTAASRQALVPLSIVASGGVDAMRAASVRQQVRQGAQALYTNWGRHDGPGIHQQKGGANGAP
jgi:hypothetical protein